MTRIAARRELAAPTREPARGVRRQFRERRAARVVRPDDVFATDGGTPTAKLLAAKQWPEQRPLDGDRDGRRRFALRPSSPSSSSSSTRNASLHPHFTPSSGRPIGLVASGRPASRIRSKARRASGGSRIHGAPPVSSNDKATGGNAPRDRGVSPMVNRDVDRRRAVRRFRAPSPSGDERWIDGRVERRRRVGKVLDAQHVRLGVEQSANAAAGERTPEFHRKQQREYFRAARAVEAIVRRTARRHRPARRIRGPRRRTRRRVPTPRRARRRIPAETPHVAPRRRDAFSPTADFRRSVRIRPATPRRRSAPPRRREARRRPVSRLRSARSDVDCARRRTAVARSSRDGR